MIKKTGIGKISELRQDLVSGEWVVIAINRAKRPHAFSGKRASLIQSKSKCPFEDPFDKKHGQHLLRYDYNEKKSKKKGRSLVVIPNKFPAFAKGVCKLFLHEGPYTWTDGVGFHEVFILRDHKRFIPELTLEEVTDLVRAYWERYRKVYQEDCIQYVLVFHNHGKEAGASVAHPHSQLIALPVIPADIARSVEGSKRYFHDHGRCVHCEMIQHEISSKKRIIDENEKFVSFVPFAPKIAFEMRIFPKTHQSNFAMLDKKNMPLLADLLRKSLARLKKGLNDPAYNFFIHTAPVGNTYDHYHWHLEILPKTSIWAGFEIGTGIEISSITPENAAEFLRKIKIKNV